MEDHSSFMTRSYRSRPVSHDDIDSFTDDDDTSSYLENYSIHSDTLSVQSYNRRRKKTHMMMMLFAVNFLINVLLIAWTCCPIKPTSNQECLKRRLFFNNKAYEVVIYESNN